MNGAGAVIPTVIKITQDIVCHFGNSVTVNFESNTIKAFSDTWNGEDMGIEERRINTLKVTITSKINKVYKSGMDIDNLQL